jgi:hypothetical protein
VLVFWRRRTGSSLPGVAAILNVAGSLSMPMVCPQPHQRSKHPAAAVPNLLGSPL